MYLVHIVGKDQVKLLFIRVVAYLFFFFFFFFFVLFFFFALCLGCVQFLVSKMILYIAYFYILFIPYVTRMKRLAIVGSFGSYVPYYGPLYDGVWLKTGGIRNNGAYSFLIFSKVSNNFFMLVSGHRCINQLSITKTRLCNIQIF